MATGNGELVFDRSRVFRKLDAKFKIGGIEAADLIAVLISGAVMNLFFGRITVGPIFIFGVPTALFFLLYYGKRGRPDGFLFHLLNYLISPGRLIAGRIETGD